MADIDFDELDKAVNDLMANVDTSKRPAGLDDPEDTVLTVPETTAQPTPEEAPVADVVAEVKAEPEAATPAVESPDAAKSEVTPASPSLAVKRRGQFMDIVHPSLNMNNTTPKSVSRQGVTLQPSVDGVTAPVAPTVPVTPTPEEVPAEAAVDQPVDEPATESTWPDPIDMATASADVAEPAETVDAEQPIETVPDTAVNEAPAEPEPLSSPFLPDAKPEKRPLGGLSDALPTADATPVAPADTPAIPVVLPEEFSGDLMAVESRDLSSHPDAAKSEAPVAAVPVEPETPVLQQQHDEVSPPSVSSDSQPPAGGSIAQQYTEQPSSGDQTNGSIYDTATYHQAIAGAQPAKKKASPLTFIIWTVVLLLVGATAGAAYFYFTR